MRSRNEIMSELEDLSHDSVAGEEHFKLISQRIKARQFSDVARNIHDVGPEVSEAYKATLLELLPHVIIRDDEDANARVARLCDAIMTKRNTMENVYDALTGGSAIVVNHVFNAGNKQKRRAVIKPMTVAWKKALETSDWSVVNLLIVNGAEIDETCLQHMPVKPVNGDTLLHIACRYRYDHLMNALLARNILPDVRNSNGETPLHLACASDNEDAVNNLIKHKADVNVVYKDADEKKITPLNLAISHNNKFILKELIDAGHKIRERDLSDAALHDMDIYEFLKSPLRERKKQIIGSSGSPTFFIHDDKSLSCLFVQLHIDDKALKINIKNNLYHIYHHANSILIPLLDLAIMASQGLHADGLQSDKKLKIIVTNKDNVSDLVPSGHGAYGIYTNKNSVFISGFDGDHLKITGTILHELKHFADKHVYGDVSPPFLDLQRDEFQGVKEELKKYLVEYSSHHTEEASAAENYLYQTINSIFSYKPGESLGGQDMEVLVKVPEIIGTIGMKKGYAWLQQHLPALLDFYENRFNPACEDYLRRQLQINAGKTGDFNKTI